MPFVNRPQLFSEVLIMKFSSLIGGLICIVATASLGLAGDAGWSFQRTGFRSTSGTPQTAVSMRNDLSWPVVYGIDQSMLNAYSLFPVANPGPVPISPPTNWHQIGSNLTRTFVSSSSVYLQAASGSPDGFGVSLQTPFISSQPTDTVITGTSFSGFQAPINGAQALKFDSQGHLFTANNTTIPGLQPNLKLFDVALSSFGEIGAVTQASGGSGPVTFWQQSPLLAGKWLSSPITVDGRSEQFLYGPSIDLAYDTASRPHVIGLDRLTTNNSVAAYRFNIISGAWTSSILDTAAIGSPPIADVAAAANDDGIIGAAWVNFGALKYAFLDTNQPSPQWVVTTVASTTPANLKLEASQGVGLAFDKSGLPVISFVDSGQRQIWIAYDPPLLTAANPATPGDFNADGAVDGNDLNSWTTSFAGEGSVADADGDGDTDGADFLAWQQGLTGASGSNASAAVPEPLSLTSGLVAAALFITTTRNRNSRKSS
jgi:hypothetical protein